MLLLLFDTREGRYAMSTENIVEIVPLVTLKRIPKSPDYVAGLINYRGNPIPVIDLCALTEGTECEPKFSTRIILLNYPFNNNTSSVLGLMAERVTETVKTKTQNLQHTRVLLEEDIASNDIKSSHEEIIQRFDLKRMVPEKIVHELIHV